MRNAVFWDVMPCASSKNDVSEECITAIIGVRKVSELGSILVTPQKRMFLQEPHGVTT
jgi:hypothetical protein